MIRRRGKLTVPRDVSKRLPCMAHPLSVLARPLSQTYLVDAPLVGMPRNASIGEVLFCRRVQSMETEQMSVWGKCTACTA